MLNTCCSAGKQCTDLEKPRKDSLGTLSNFVTMGKFNLTLLLPAMNIETAIVAELKLFPFTIIPPKKPTITTHFPIPTKNAFEMWENKPNMKHFYPLY